MEVKGRIKIGLWVDILIVMSKMGVIEKSMYLAHDCMVVRSTKILM